MENKPIAPVKAGIELAEKQATPQVDATLVLSENYDVTENALFPETPSEQNAVMEAIQFTKSLEPLELIIKPEQEIDYNALDATAAGAGDGGGGSDGNSFVQLTRIHESVDGNSYSYGFNPLGVGDILEGIGENAEQQVVNSTEILLPPVVEPPKPPVEPPKPPKDHQDNGGGNGIDDAPGNSGDTKGDDADGSNTPGTKNTLNSKDVLDSGHDEIKLPAKGNNGFGNGDQTAPGNSLTHNTAENDISLDTIKLHKLLDNT